MSGLIDRQAAIEHFRVTDPAGTFAYCDAIIEFLENLPSAQPEIIRCKDCKYREYRNTCSLVEGLTVLRNDSFCSYAERKVE